MKISRAILTGALVWVFIFIAFAGLGLIPILKDSLNRQVLIVGILIIPFATFGAYIYYKKGNKSNGFVTGLIMAATALVLDAIITVPLIEIPNGRSYQSFFGYPFLWLLAAVNVATVFFYWKLKIKRSTIKEIL